MKDTGRRLAISSNSACSTSATSALSTGDNVTDTMISVLIAAFSLTWTVYSASTSINSYAEVPTTDNVNTPLTAGKANRTTVGGSFVEEDGVVPAAGQSGEQGEDEWGGRGRRRETAFGVARDGSYWTALKLANGAYSPP